MKILKIIGLLGLVACSASPIETFVIEPAKEPDKAMADLLEKVRNPPTCFEHCRIDRFLKKWIYPEVIQRCQVVEIDDAGTRYTNKCRDEIIEEFLVKHEEWRYLFEKVNRFQTDN